MAFFSKQQHTQQKAESESSLPSVFLTPQEAEVLLQAVKQASFKGEYAKQVVILIEKLEIIAFEE